MFRSVKKTIVISFSRCWSVNIILDDSSWIKNIEYCIILEILV